MRRELPILSAATAAAIRDGPTARPDATPGLAPARVGFFTDTTLCIGCKACEVACKEWNDVPADGYVWSGKSYDNTAELSANSWRHVAFIEQDRPLRVRTQPTAPASDRDAAALTAVAADATYGTSSFSQPAPFTIDGSPGGAGVAMRWLMSSDVCKHCTDAACLDVCPTGALVRTELGTVVVQNDVCNGCGYCVSACPFGVIGRREIEGDPGHGLAQKCTLCYDRSKDGLEPACAKACPTQSIQFGELDELRVRAQGRLDAVLDAGYDGAQLYGADPGDGVGGFGAFFLLLDRPEVYGLPPDPVATTRDLPSIWGAAAAAAGLLAGLVAVAGLGRRS